MTGEVRHGRCASGSPGKARPSGEPRLVTGNALDEARIDRLLANAGAFDAIVDGLQTAASTDQDLADASRLFGTHLKASLAASGTGREVVDFASSHQLCLAQLSDPTPLPLDVAAMMASAGDTCFHAASLSARVSDRDGQPAIRAVFSIDPAVNRIVMIPQ